MDQLTLGQVIDVLERVDDKSRGVAFDFAATAPTRVRSYRGYYDQPALGWAATGYSGSHQPPSVADLITELRGAVGRTFEGWKGGDYTYDFDSPLWVDNPGDCNGTYITGADTEGYYVVLKTECQCA